MHRLQISLTQNQYEFLKSEAFVSGQSMAAILREFLDDIIQRRQQEILEKDPIWQVIGVAQEVTGPTDISTTVDHYLYGQSLEAVGISEPLPKVAEEADEYAPD